ncbi:lysophospholipid acyltransferase family protein [Bacillus massiliigorillae]|uniref:lysophospholipid acyltransferase family protein n=1 Tax=Bacillus massiliigorillae TaxID=1243664 RepID=UPI0003A396C3|nr:lysophospholipid acyltransferase family protein [Bacillus massiliigorillae]
MNTFVCTVLFIVIKLFGLLKIKGKTNKPSNHRYVVTCSHTSWIDCIMLAIAVYPTPVHFMAKKELFNRSFSRKFMESVKAFPVNRENPGPSALKIPLKILKNNKCVGIFPSGTRTSEDVPLKRGAVTIAMKAKAPLLPAVYKGPTKFKQILKGEKAVVIFGTPIDFEKELQSVKKEHLIESGVNLLEARMKQLQL